MKTTKLTKVALNLIESQGLYVEDINICVLSRVHASAFDSLPDDIGTFPSSLPMAATVALC